MRDERRSSRVSPPRHSVVDATLFSRRRQPALGRFPRMTVLFWDIDGTLLTTAKAGVFAWEDAVRELTGREFELVRMRIAGLTDYQIAQRTFETLGIEI